MFNERLNAWYSHFCKNCDSATTLPKIIDKAASLSYQASVQHALWKDGKHIGFNGKTREKNMVRAESERYLREFLAEAINCTDEEALFSRMQQAWDDIREIYHENKITWYNYGNAQKRLAMAMKFCFVIAYRHSIVDRSHAFVACAFPVDRIMMNHAYETFGIARILPSWSQCDDKEAFSSYLTLLKAAVGNQGKRLLEYEIESWQNQ